MCFYNGLKTLSKQHNFPSIVLFFPGNQTAADQEHARGEERDAEVDRQLG